jgi:toxin ParE1/3/4
MASYELSGAADRDLTEIYVYSYRQFGESRADAYLHALRDCFALLADQPTMGRSIDSLRTGYFRFEHAHHTVFYVRTRVGIRVMRVLHERMDPERHL